MSAESDAASAGKAPDLFEALVSHERGDRAAAAPSLRPRLPYVFGAETGVESEAPVDPAALSTRQAEKPAAGPFVPPAAIGQPSPTIAAVAGSDPPPPGSALLASRSEAVRRSPEPERSADRKRPVAREAEDANRRGEVGAQPRDPASREHRVSEPGPAPSEPRGSRRGEHILARPPIPAIPPIAATRTGAALLRSEPVIEISIGRIDVRAAPGQQAAPAVRAAPAQPRDDRLAAYLDRRSRGARS
ncbi:hypothetical protein WOC76_19940 [Methylocystis sp. IM3]|jgi:hypothetical protein|uniref:hypothetical protein n=1 Tax=unclassified Methylocystis TaxID=2625913 RepID=UPI0030F63CF3